MKARAILVGLTLLLSVGGASYLGYKHYASRHRQCDLCGRPIYAHLMATVHLKSRARIDTCCPRCALRYEMERPGEVARVTVADSNTGEVIPAARATYVEGSDAEGCHPEPKEAPRESGAEFDLKFDRCLPSLIAFKTDAEARDFQKQFGGRVFSFTQVLQNLKIH